MKLSHYETVIYLQFTYKYTYIYTQTYALYRNRHTRTYKQSYKITISNNCKVCRFVESNFKYISVLYYC